MDRIIIIEKIHKVLLSILGHEDFELKDEQSAKDIDGWDSLSHIMIITEIEKEFKIRFKLAELSDLDNVGSLVDLVREKCQAKIK